LAGNDELDFLITGARRAVEELQADPRLSAPVSGRARPLAEHVHETLRAIADGIATTEAAMPTATSDAAKRTHARNLRLYASLARAVHIAIPWLAPPRDGLDLGSLYLIDETALALIGRGLGVVAAADSSYMYSTTTYPFRRILEDYLGRTLGAADRPIVVNYPISEADTVLLHGLFAHELGHAASDKHELVEAVLQPMVGDPHFAAGLRAATNHYEETYNYSAPKARTAVLFRLRSWVEELICDHLALQFLGPSYLFSFAAFVLATSWNEPSAKHPAPALRVQLLRDQAAALGWEILLRNDLPAIWTWLNEVAAAPVPTMTPDTRFAHETCNRQGGEVRTVCASRIGARSYEPQDYAPVASELNALLQRRIPPVQLDGGAVDRRNILLAAWLFALKARGGAPSSIPATLRDVEFQRFVGKALEMSTVLETWVAVP
jgi:hypothetical protein